jgi:7-cyano-7-deazaguanine synthase|tara:strand:+ start:90 stop:737 length:648 start_codon:yes stop_codon:yes gene_type:complete
MKIVVILSGGMDSTTVLYHAIEQGYEVEALSFNYGQKHSKELEFAKWHCEQLNIPHKIIKLDFSCLNSALLDEDVDVPEGHYEDENMKATVVPFRNGIMLSYAVGYAENINASGVMLGSHKGDHAVYPDCREIFTKHMNDAAITGTYNKIEIISPFNDLMKWDLVKRGTELNIPYHKTWSCYKGKDNHCGKCGTCVERLEAFEKANRHDVVEYDK